MTDNPALVPEEPKKEAVEKTYKVVGEASVFGHGPGVTFKATLSSQQEVMLTQYGHLQVVDETAEKTHSKLQRDKGEKAPQESETSIKIPEEKE